MCLVASFISSLDTRTRGGTVWGVGAGLGRIEPCGERQAVVGAARGDGTGRYCSNKRRKIAHNWLEEGSRYHRYEKQGRIKLFLCIDRIPGCLPAAGPPSFDPPMSLVNLPPFATCACPPRCCGILLFFEDSNGVGRLLAWRTSTTCHKQILALDDFTLDPTDLHLSLAIQNALSFPTCSRHKEGTGLASSPWNALHTICSHARAQHCHNAESCFLLSLAGFLMRQSSIR